MKQIIFLRHWKATEKWPKIDDWSRMLTDKGIEKTKEYFDAIRDKITHVDAIVSSGAWRTKMTAEVIALELKMSREMIQYHSWLWTIDYQTIVSMIHSFPVSRKSVIVVWHNDTLSDAAMSLTSAPLDSMVKSGFVGLSFSVEDWGLVDKKNNSEVWQYNGDK
jgi:phosphohistidine phosphatase